MQNTLYENDTIYITKENSQIPWLKIFTKENCKELSDCTKEIRDIIFDTINTIEKTMLLYYKPKKINIAIFGNYLPKLHVHIMARFENDSHFPEPMWGKKQREGNLDLPNFDNFIILLMEQL